MERYGRADAAAEESQPDPTPEWSSPPAAETGLEEPIWQVGLGDSYPERPGEADCIYYLKTGFCGYGSRCRFNHPRDRNSVVGAGRPGGGEYPERAGQPVCKFYMRTGSCKFGTSCKYHHPRQGGGSVSPVSLNYLGYPLRPSERECSYYVRTGECKFGVSCKFHHPQPDIQGLAQIPAPAAAPIPAAVSPSAVFSPVQSPSGPSAQQYGVVASNWQVARPPSMVPGSYVQGPYGPVLLSPGMVSVPGWSPYQAPLSPVVSPNPQPTAGATFFRGVTQLSPSAPAFAGPYAPMPSSVGPSSRVQTENIYPDRPGQPECQYYLKTGECKFGSSCRYHHPPEWNAPKTDCAFSPMDLPMRPGAPLCAYYAQHGICKFGRTCKFDHPMGTLSYSPSASSLADVPVAPYPVGTSIGTLAPSSSSSDLRPELVSGSKDLSTRMSSSASTSSGSVGSILSKSGHVPHCGTQQSSHGSASSTGSTTTTGHGGEARTSS